MSPEERICKNCGEAFIATRKDRVFCTNKCAVSFSAVRVLESRVTTKTCPHCEKEFTTTNPVKIYCTRTCLYASQAIENKETRFVLHTIVRGVWIEVSPKYVTKLRCIEHYNNSMLADIYGQYDEYSFKVVRVPIRKEYNN